MRHIEYAINNGGMVYSRVGSEAAFPVLEYDRIGEGGNFDAPLTYHLERGSVYALSAEWGSLVWTRMVPVEVKNIHRRFWGFAPLRSMDESYHLPRGVDGLARANWGVKLS